MSLEQIPPGGEEAVRYLDRLAEARYPYIEQKMNWFVSSGLCDASEMFGYRAERIDTLGQELAYVLGGLATSEIEVAGMQRSLRFGLALARELTQSERYDAGLATLESLFLQPGAVVNNVTGSYERYLQHHRHLIAALRGNIKTLAPEGQIYAQDAISFILEEAERETFCDAQMAGIDTEIERFFDPPSGRTT